MHSDAQRFYTILGLEPAASADAIGLAFRRRAKALHPDAPSGDADAFILLKRAYDTLSDPGQRAAYDRACQPPEPVPPHRWAMPARLPPMPPPLVKPRRRGGIGFGRYVIAFVVMAAISLGGIEAMISFTEAPSSSIRTRETPRPAATPTTVEPAATAAQSTPAPGSSPSGFWDPTPATHKN